jgi:hypothetical protein
MSLTSRGVERYHGVLHEKVTSQTFTGMRAASLRVRLEEQ